MKLIVAVASDRVNTVYTCIVWLSRNYGDINKPLPRAASGSVVYCQSARMIMTCNVCNLVKSHARLHVHVCTHDYYCIIFGKRNSRQAFLDVRTVGLLSFNICLYFRTKIKTCKLIGASSLHSLTPCTR